MREVGYDLGGQNQNPKSDHCAMLARSRGRIQNPESKSLMREFMQQESEFKIQNPQWPSETVKRDGESRIQNPDDLRHEFDTKWTEFRIRIREMHWPKEIVQKNPENPEF